jgi:Ca-activated chloride channel family protein
MRVAPAVVLLFALSPAGMAADASTLDVIGGADLLRVAPGDPAPLPMLDLQVRLDVTGMMVHGTVTQTFLNPTTDEIEAVYVFPLPEQAAVHHMEMRIGERRIVSVIQEREEARRTYVQAREEGRKAALVEQKRPNLFTASAANINPGESIDITLEYIQELDYNDGEFQLAFPLTFMPRYAPPAAQRRAVLQQAIQEMAAALAAKEGPVETPRARIEVRVQVGFPLDSLDSPSHEIRTWWDGETLMVEPSGTSVAADRDFLLRWRPQLDREPRWAVHTEERDDGSYALLMLLPPLEDAGDGSGLATETLFIVDVSGSMKGPSIRQARQALLAALDRLRPDDAFNLLAFNDHVMEFAPSFLEATEGALEEARAWVRGLGAGGGTQIFPALRHGVDLTRLQESDRVRRILFLTDGAVQNEEEVLRSILRDLGTVRLHALGIGRAPNRYLMRRMAGYGHGLCDFITDTVEAENRIDAFFARLHRPVMTDLSLEWEGREPLEVYPARLPDLHAGEPLFVSARLPRGPEAGRVTLRGQLPDGSVTFRGELQGDAPGESGVAVRWARARVSSLFQELHAGGDAEAIRREVIEVSKTFHIVTRYTSLVALEEFPSAVDHARHVRVPNALPAGSLPRGGTMDPLLLLLAGLLAAGGSVLLLLTHRRA